MANTLGNYDETYYAQQSLIWLKKSLGLAPRMHMGYDAERRTFGKGDAIAIRRPGTFTAQSAPGSVDDATTDSVSIDLTSHQEVRFAAPDKEFAYTGPAFVRDHIRPAMYALADKIDQDLATLITTVPHKYTDAAGAATIAGITSTRQELFDVKAPIKDEENMFFMIGGKEENDLIQLSGFSQHQGAGDLGVSTQLSGQLGRRFGFNFFSNQNRSTIAFNNLATDQAGAVNQTGANNAVGSTTLAVDGLGSGSETLVKGTIIDVVDTAGDTQEYALTANATLSSGAATLAINPGLRTTIADNAVVNVLSGQDNVTKNENVAFHRHWAALAFARLPEFDEFSNRLGVEATVVQDETTGIAIRFLTYYDGANSRRVIVCDVLYGYAELNADLACRYHITNS